MDYDQLILVFTSIIYEALPFIVLGVVLAGLLEEFVPQQAIARVIPSNRLFAIGLGGLLGIIFPMCECGIIVVMRRLLRKGLPLSVCAAYMLAGPVINVVVLTSTFVAFNYPDDKNWILGGPWGMVGLRAGLAFVVAVITALIVDRQWRRYGTALLHPSVTVGLGTMTEEDNEGAHADTPAMRLILTALKNVMILKPVWFLLIGAYKAIRGDAAWRRHFANVTETALNDFVDIMAFLIIGACLAAAGRLVLREGTAGIQEAPAAANDGPKDKAGDPRAAGEPAGAKKEAPRESKLVTTLRDYPSVAILMMMGFAILFCLCSEADAFVAANFQVFWPPASKLAFLVLGPMLDLKLYLMYTRVFRPRLIFTIILSVVVQVFVYTMIVHYLVR